MLPARHRLNDAESFRRTTRRGDRASAATLVAYAVPARDGHPRVGLVVSKAVGNAAQRNRVKRRLRHLMAPRVADLRGDDGVARDLVLRALPAAAGVSSSGLERDLEVALARVGGRRRR